MGFLGSLVLGFLLDILILSDILGCSTLLGSEGSLSLLDLANSFNRFYGMPARYHAGITFGFVWSFKLNSDIWTALAWSRDGVTPAWPWYFDLRLG